jgi:hypothetical protein
MSTSTSAVTNLLRSPLLPFWLLVALLPFGRSAELATLLCAIGAVIIWRRDGRAFWNNPGARLLVLLLACYIGAALLSRLRRSSRGKSWTTVLALLRYLPLGLYACYVIRGEHACRFLCGRRYRHGVLGARRVDADAHGMEFARAG